MATRQQKLDDLAMKILQDKICPDLAATATQLVFGDGNPAAELMFIGEAPGKNEDQQGKPFVGAAGRFLNDMLKIINLRREDVYITNIVKYRPPNNREPLPQEKKDFLPYLQAQLEIIKPKILITLGNHSLSCFLPSLRISQCHGQPKRISLNFQNSQSFRLNHPPKPFQLIIMPLFHPAAALYNGGMRQTLIDDFIKIPVVLQQIADVNYVNF